MQNKNATPKNDVLNVFEQELIKFIRKTQGHSYIWSDEGKRAINTLLARSPYVLEGNANDPS